MSDSVKKYYEMVEDGLIDEKKETVSKLTTYDKISLEEVSLLDRASKAGLLVEVVTEALCEVRNHPNTSNLLALQIACNDWDV